MQNSHCPQIGAPLVELDTTESTNTYAVKLARDGDAADGTVVWAHRQTAGRGRQGNIWTSQDGNLFMSVVIAIDPAETGAIGQLSFVVAVAVARALRGILPASVCLSLKWPNDVLIEGRKAAGILLESESAGINGPKWVVAGIGVNILSAPEGAACLKEWGEDAGVEVARVLEKISLSLREVLAEWRSIGFSPIRSEWMQSAWRLGDEIRVRIPSETFQAVFRGIDGNGALLAEMPDGTQRRICSGEVIHGAAI